MFRIQSLAAATLLGPVLAVGLALQPTPVQATTVELNFTDFLPATEPLNTAAGTINGWQYIHEVTSGGTVFIDSASPIFSFATQFAPKNLRVGTTGGEELVTKTENGTNAQVSVINLEFGGSGFVSGLVQGFNSVPVGGGLFGEVTVEVNWFRKERAGDGFFIVDGAGNFNQFAYTPTGTSNTRQLFTHTFTPTQATFQLGFFSGFGADTNASIDFIRVTSEAASAEPIPEPASFALLGLAGAAMLRRRRKAGSRMMI